jgi:hypothetical protein
MATPVYKSYMGHTNEAWYALSAEEQQALMSKMAEAGKRVGIKTLITCDTTWSLDHYQFFGVEEFPSMEALQQYHDALMKMNWFRYCDGQTLIGTKWE